MRHTEPPTSHNNDNYIYVVHNIEKDGLQGFFLHACEPTEPTNTPKIGLKVSEIVLQDFGL